MNRQLGVGEITRLLAKWTVGRPKSAPERAMVYRELRQIASAYVRDKRGDLLVDHAREYEAQNRGAKWERLSLETPALTGDRPEQLPALDEVLERLGSSDRRQAQVVEMRFFAGHTARRDSRDAECLGQPVKLDGWFSEAWLQRQMRSGRQAHD